MITRQIEKINLQVFNINSIITTSFNSNNKCPICKSKFVRFTANSKSCRLYCMKCFWENYYMVINKNG